MPELERERLPTNSTSEALNPNQPSLNLCHGKETTRGRELGGARAINHPDTYLGSAWQPVGAPMPDPRVPRAVTEPDYIDTLMSPNRERGLGFSRYVAEC